MADLAVIVPSRGRPDAVAELIRTFRETCALSTKIVLALDRDDRAFDQYVNTVSVERDLPSAGDPTEFGTTARTYVGGWSGPVGRIVWQETGTMVSALNHAALTVATTGDPRPFAIGFMGDDHRPRTYGWDARYLEALHELGTGLVYGNDLIQGERLPTQVAMTADIIRTLGYMAPPDLTHMYVDDAWLALGRELGRITYLPDVVVEHVHPVAGKAQWDDGYARVNAPAVYARDRAMHERWVRESLPFEVARIKAAAR